MHHLLSLLLIFINLWFLLVAVSKNFWLDINAMQVKELNFILRSEIFVHYNKQLKASHKIQGCTPSYTSYEDS